ncbi:MAG: hypothetical protein HYY18_00565 [Planctomycetes bacterium]|nr:hypothetical protein [Planctomycetota bacterium]
MSLQLKPRRLYRVLKTLPVTDSRIPIPAGTILKFVERRQAPPLEEWEFYDRAKDLPRSSLAAPPPEMRPRFEILSGGHLPAHPVVERTEEFLKRLRFRKATYRVLRDFEASSPLQRVIRKGTRLELIGKRSTEQPIEWRFETGESFRAQVRLGTRFPGDGINVMKDPQKYLESGVAQAFPSGLTLVPGVEYRVRRRFQAGSSTVPVPEGTWLQFVTESGDAIEFQSMEEIPDRVVLRRSDPLLSDVFPALHAFLAPYDSETDFLPRESGSLKFEAHRVEWEALRSFVAEAARRLDPDFQVPSLTGFEPGHSGEHGEPGYAKSRRYGPPAGSQIIEIDGETEDREGLLHDRTRIEANRDGKSVVEVEWAHAEGSGHLLSLFIQGRGTEVRPLLEQFRKEFGKS